MMMWGHVRFQSKGTVMERNFLKDSGIQERLHVLVNGAQGNAGDPLFNLLVDQFRRGMIPRINNGFVDNLTLKSKGKALLLTAEAEIV